MDNTDEIISWIQRQYFQAINFKDFDWNTLNKACVEVHQKHILNETVFHPLNKAFPLSDSYNFTFLKKLLSVYEAKNWEICDEIYSVIVDLTARKKCEDDVSFKSYFMPCREIITLSESTKLVSQGTTGLNTWQAGLFLSNWILKNKEILHEKNVLELGCGVGLTGLVSSHYCSPNSYIFTDYNENVLGKLQENLKLNGYTERCLKRNTQTFSKTASNLENEPCSEEILFKMFEKAPISGRQIINERNRVFECNTCSGRSQNYGGTSGTQAIIAHLDWEKTITKQIEVSNPEIILASDVIFEPTIIEPFVNVLRTLLNINTESSTAYVASTVRNSQTYEYFLTLLEQYKLVKSDVVMECLQDDSNNLFIHDRSSEIRLIKINTTPW